MKGDYYRYISEYATGETHKQVADKALEAYSSASDLATSSLKTTHPIRLGLALNFSVFHYEVLNDPAKACNLAKTAFDDAIADIEHIEEEQYKDATTIMQLIRDNLTLWTSELQDEENAEGGIVDNLWGAFLFYENLTNLHTTPFPSTFIFYLKLINLKE